MHPSSCLFVSHRLWVLVTVGAILRWTILSASANPATRVSGPLPQHVYLWQRTWNEAVRDAVLQHATNFTELAALAAEVTWRSGSPQAVRVSLDYELLRQATAPLGLVLRIGPFNGPFQADDRRARWLGDFSKELIQEAASNQTHIVELQIDFDCAESKLDGFGVWLEAIRSRLAPLPVVITALPSWLKQPSFKRLIDKADGYVLQVHSLSRPSSIQAPFSLCDPQLALQAVELADRLGKPFRVALPTYGYLLAFDSQGRFAGLSAEGPAKNWPSDFKMRELRADPLAMATLVQRWTTGRSRSLNGIIWYRLPVAGERFNWPWATLAEVMNGKAPHTSAKVEIREPQPGLVEADLINTGQTDFNQPVRVVLHWKDARLLASDGLQGIEVTEAGSNRIVFVNTPEFARLPPGERRTLGWIRLDQKAEVTIETEQDNGKDEGDSLAVPR
jgi:hypothetical protein